MTLKTLRIVSLSIMAVGAFGAIGFAYFELVKAANVFCAVMVAGWLFFSLFNRCPGCKGHLRGFELYCPHCGSEIDESKKIL